LAALPGVKEAGGVSLLPASGNDSVAAIEFEGKPVKGLFEAPQALAVLQDANMLFWNASVRANRHYTEKRFGAAIEAYGAALELTPRCAQSTSPRDCATLHYNRARARYRLGAHCGAIEDCSTALNHDATYRNALAQRAECYMALFDFERAARDFQALLEGQGGKYTHADYMENGTTQIAGMTTYTPSMTADPNDLAMMSKVKGKLTTRTYCHKDNAFNFRP
jgi:tetratricopeptide (TPR) repeat protein